jgi:hypothetical protein
MGLAWLAASTMTTSMLPESRTLLVLPTHELLWQTVVCGWAPARISWMV